MVTVKNINFVQATLSHENDGEPLTGALDGYAHQSHDELIRKEFQVYNNGDLSLQVPDVVALLTYII